MALIEQTTSQRVNDQDLWRRQCTPEQIEDIERGAKQVHALLSDATIRARYRVEVYFPSTRSDQGDVLGLVEVWESSGTLDGQGDVRSFVCPGKEKGVNECRAIIPASTYTGQYVCPGCHHVWKPAEVNEGVLYRTHLENWACILYDYYVRVQHNADLVLHYHPIDVMTAYRSEGSEYKRYTNMEKARTTRRRHIYPLRNIIQDVSTGADPIKRVLAFLKA